MKGDSQRCEDLRVRRREKAQRSWVRALVSYVKLKGLSSLNVPFK